MSEWTEAGYTWGEAVEVIAARVKAEEAEHGERHGLRGVFAGQFGGYVVAGQLRGDVPILANELIGGAAVAVELVAEADVDDELALAVDAPVTEALWELFGAVPVSAIVVAASAPVAYQSYQVDPVTATRFRFGDVFVGDPDQMPVTHHLLAVALGIDGWLPDRNVLQGAW